MQGREWGYLQEKSLSNSIQAKKFLWILSTPHNQHSYHFPACWDIKQRKGTIDVSDHKIYAVYPSLRHYICNDSAYFPYINALYSSAALEHCSVNPGISIPGSDWQVRAVQCKSLKEGEQAGNCSRQENNKGVTGIWWCEEGCFTHTQLLGDLTNIH